MTRQRIAGVALVALGFLAAGVLLAGRGEAAVPFSADIYEPDGTRATARVLPGTSTHTFSADSDSDWARISAEATGQPFVIETLPLDGEALNTAVVVTDSSGTPIDGNDDHAIFPDTLASGLVFRAPAPGTYYIEVKPSLPGEVGRYRLTVAKGIARRVSGGNRYSTAAEVSRLTWSNTGLASWGAGNGPTSVVVAGGEDAAGALAGSVLAAANGTSLLLTPATTLSPETRSEIGRLGRSRRVAGERLTVYLIGPTATVSSAVESSLRSLPEVGAVIRLAGANPAATASRVAAELKATAGTGDTAFVVNSAAWADAIGAAPVAATAGAPMLFTDAQRLPTSTKSALSSLGIRRVIVVGGPVSVSPAVESQIASLTGTPPLRLGGSSRYDTARLVAQHGVDAYGMDPRTVVVASGEVFPDALSAASITWWTGGPVLLTGKSSLSSEIAGFTAVNGPLVMPSYVVGGPATVSDSVLNALGSSW